jgi:hypothetical protein
MHIGATRRSRRLVGIPALRDLLKFLSIKMDCEPPEA